MSNRARFLALCSVIGPLLLLSLALVLGSGTLAAADPPPIPTPAQPAGAGRQASADLVVESITFSPANPEVGQIVEITVTVKNQGEANSSGFFYVYRYTDPAPQPPTGTTPIDGRMGTDESLAPGQSRPFFWGDEAIPTEGPHVLYAWVDPENGVSESDESNNLAGPVEVCVGTCQPVDAYEDDDTCAQARPIAGDGSPQRHNLVPMGDQDWVVVAVQSGRTYRLQTVGVGADARLAPELHATCDDPGTYGSLKMEFTPAADGPYYIMVQHVQTSHGPDTDYDLRITALDDCGGYHEPNDYCGRAVDLPVDGGPQSHSFCKQDDSDWSVVAVKAGARYVISATGSAPGVEPQIALFESCFREPVAEGESRLDYQAAKDGLLRIRVHNLDPGVYGPASQYALEARQAATCTPDAQEDDDVAAAARPLAAGGPVLSYNVCPAGDEDWVRFEAAAGTVYAVETLNLGPDADTELCVYDAAGSTALVCDDDGGPGTGSRLAWQAPAAGTYTIRIKPYEPGVSGDGTRFDLSLLTQPCLPDALEPDDNRQAARPINSDGSPQPHNTCPQGDADWVSFSAGPGHYVIETAGLGPEGDTFLELYDDQGNLLESNDDYGSDGSSHIYHPLPAAGTYYARVRSVDPTLYGQGSEFSLRVYAGEAPTPTDEPEPPPTVTPEPPAPPSNVRTLILVNRQRMASVYGEEATATMMARLDLLAAHDLVRGEIVRLDLNDTVQAAYAAWTSGPASQKSVDMAKEVTAAIRGLILDLLGQRDGVQYLVLVGDDRVLPFQRLYDYTDPSVDTEDGYLAVNKEHPTGAALKGNYFLTDDYYAARDPATYHGREWYVPDLAAGRLVETPGEIAAFIDTFLAGSELAVDRALITGYQSLQDSAGESCKSWRARLGAGAVDCSLIGEMWSVEALKDRQLRAVPPYKLQNINCHATHGHEQTPDFGVIYGSEIGVAPTDLRRGLVYTPGCHAGLNVPPNNLEPIDLPQAFAQKGANYVANTGFGYGAAGGIGFSERLVKLYSEELARGTSVSMGQALVAAKQRFYHEDAYLSEFDEKAAQEFTFYGLPMYRLTTAARSLTRDNPFPSAQMILSLDGPFGDQPVLSGTVSIQLVGADAPSAIMSQTVTQDGSFFALDGHVSTPAGRPVQPVIYGNATVPGMTARGVVLLAGQYQTLPDFDPLIVSPRSGLVTDTLELTYDRAGWFPAVPGEMQRRADETSIVVPMSQFDPAVRQSRLYRKLTLDLYYSASTDYTPPDVLHTAAYLDRDTGQIHVKVGAQDTAGIARVVVAYTHQDGVWNSLDLSLDPDIRKWTGSFAGGADTRYLVQVLDRAGNLTQVTDKGRYLAPSVSSVLTMPRTFLPLVMRK